MSIRKRNKRGQFTRITIDEHYFAIYVRLGIAALDRWRKGR